MFQNISQYLVLENNQKLSGRGMLRQQANQFVVFQALKMCGMQSWLASMLIKINWTTNV